MSTKDKIAMLQNEATNPMVQDSGEAVSSSTVINPIQGGPQPLGDYKAPAENKPSLLKQATKFTRKLIPTSNKGFPNLGFSKAISQANESYINRLKKLLQEKDFVNIQIAGISYLKKLPYSSDSVDEFYNYLKGLVPNADNNNNPVIQSDMASKLITKADKEAIAILQINSSQPGFEYDQRLTDYINDYLNV